MTDVRSPEQRRGAPQEFVPLLAERAIEGSGQSQQERRVSRGKELQQSLPPNTLRPRRVRLRYESRQGQSVNVIANKVGLEGEGSPDSSLVSALGGQAIGSCSLHQRSLCSGGVLVSPEPGMETGLLESSPK
jgi:hypothetical protein